MNIHVEEIAYINIVCACYNWLIHLLFVFLSVFQLNIDPEALKPKLPNKKELKPYPITCYIEYKGHEDAVTSISVEASGQWMASGMDIDNIYLGFN